ncbi:class IV lanthionine synthetase LanL [Streptomyces sp. NPDC090025]|uniref:class IV lanthionine synthetase LanL n=1 Tax=Streptomyces sp. NPDC090025 TaxID=3365922 RepID=UPI0038338E1F
MTSHATEADLEALLHQALRTSDTTARWTTVTDDMWCRLAPRATTPRSQGWKLHVSATSGSAPEVLAKALPVLLADTSPFKFARSLENVGALNSRATPRGNSGKFLTVYPRSDADAARLALALHEATLGLAGPQILSDRAYTPGSLVHYRYGAFAGRQRLSDEGLLVWYYEDPDGNPVEDRRTGRYTQPDWAVSPFPAAVPAPRPQPAPTGPVLLGGRFAVREAIRFTNKGGVYRATDTTTGAPAIVKEARPHVEADASGADVRDWLRAEARTLERLRGTGLAPEPLALFEHAGHLFLAQEEIPGRPLRTWVAEHFRDVGADRYRADALTQAGHLVELLAEAHAHGCVLRDFTPANVMVRPDGSLRLIDLELAVLAGDEDQPTARPTTVGTPGFSAPERLRHAPVAPSGDHYSLGATLCFLFTGKVPHPLPEEPATRTAEQRLADWLTACDAAVALPAGLPELVLGLMRDEPAERTDPAAARTAVRALGRTAGVDRTTGVRAVADADADAYRREGPDGDLDVVIAGMVAHLLDTMTPDDERRLWPVSTTAGETDPCTVQQGAAGVLAVLTRCLEIHRTHGAHGIPATPGVGGVGGAPADPGAAPGADPRLAEAIRTAGHWIAAHADPRTVRPGLHFGARGTAWALYDAGRAVDDPALLAHATELALAPQQPSPSPSHDITHGAAGSGLAAAHLWRRTGDPRFATLVEADAERLTAAARRDASGVTWPVPAESAAAPAAEGQGTRYLGFAHGTAGIATFLLTAADVTGRKEYRDLAIAAGEGLVAQALRVGGAAQWPAKAADSVPTAPYWCHGSAGIGSFLLRLWQATGDERYADLAHRAGHAVVERAPRAPLTQCHGLAGNGDFLLDLADATGTPAHRAAAGRLARLLTSERARRAGHVVFPNEYGDVSTGWSDGAAGILAFLLRVRHQGSRLWTSP